MVKTGDKAGKSNYYNLECGDIIKIYFSPSQGHEQKGCRPGLVISDPITQKELNGLITVAPITGSTSTFFTRVNLDKYNIRTKGDILVDQIKVLDLSKRRYTFIEKAPQEVLSRCNLIFNAIYEKLLSSYDRGTGVLTHRELKACYRLRHAPSYPENACWKYFYPSASATPKGWHGSLP